MRIQSETQGIRKEKRMGEGLETGNGGCYLREFLRCAYKLQNINHHMLRWKLCAFLAWKYLSTPSQWLFKITLFQDLIFVLSFV